MKKTTFAVIVGNRDFFPGELCLAGRQNVLDVLADEGFNAISLDTNATEYGSVKTYEDSVKCAELLRENRDTIDGIIITLPNFGDEKAVVGAIRMSGLRVPILVHAYPDELDQMDPSNRRDSFCGKMSVCNNLRQYGFKYSLTDLHTVDPKSAEFRSDLHRFAAICRITDGLPKMRIGLVGARPAAFNTVRFSEKLLEANGISVEPVDLLEIVGAAEKLDDASQEISSKLQSIEAYISTAKVPENALLRVAKFGVALDDWMSRNHLNASAIQCWNALEQYMQITPCTLMSMMSSQLMPSACETDVTGAISMYILQLASGRASALVDWNNNYGDDEDKAVLFHCSNFPEQFFESAEMDYPPILARTLGQENTYGTLSGRLKQGALTFARISTDDTHGRIRGYVGEGQLTGDPLNTFGGHGVVHVERFQALLHHICNHGFEHHVAINPGNHARAIEEALDKYLGWEIYKHN